jgi:asparagine synthase (glutamine-hydrolysing)
MCGIAGELSFGRPVAPENVEAMRDALRHRGPDDAGLYCEGPVGLGHRRLTIIDLSEDGCNPLWTEDRSLAIVFNGEVYNYREVRETLVGEGYRFATATDTEVVLNAIHRWGMTDALQKLIGMFAFAVWSATDRCLFLARDRVGVKPLFYARQRDRLLFGSELRALYAHPQYEKRLNRRGLGQFFVMGTTLGDTTALANTYRVPSGHFIRVDLAGDLRLERYWSLDSVTRGSFPGTFDDAVEELERLSESAFAYRLVSDVPVGVFLSGGIDSTFLAAILKHRLGVDVPHITIGFRDARYDEAPVAVEIARQLGIRHRVEYLDAPDAAAALRGFAETYDEPFGDTSGMPTAMVCAIAREDVKVALSADGGDEQFCGYESYPMYAGRYRQMRRLPGGGRRLAAAAMSALPYESLISWYSTRKGERRTNLRMISTFEKAIEVLRAEAPSDVVRIMNEKGWTVRDLGTLLGEGLGDVVSDTVLAHRALGIEGEDESALMDQMMRADFHAFLRDDILTKVDRASMAVSLECREPFLDHRLAEFAFSLPMEFHYANGEHKRLLKHVLRQWISEPILAARKRGFVIPLYEWMRGPWRPLVREYLSPERVRAVGVLDERVVASEVDRFYRYEGRGAERLQLLLNFQMWAERWYLS